MLRRSFLGCLTFLPLGKLYKKIPGNVMKAKPSQKQIKFFEEFLNICVKQNIKKSKIVNTTFTV